jgi:hypothetical protein
MGELRGQATEDRQSRRGDLTQKRCRLARLETTRKALLHGRRQSLPILIADGRRNGLLGSALPRWRRHRSLRCESPGCAPIRIVRVARVDGSSTARLSVLRALGRTRRA